MDQHGMTHEERMAIAERLRDLILERYGEAILATFVTSSTARGLDLPFSDLELTVVLRDGVDVESRSYLYRGILMEIEYIQESAILRNARRVRSEWPVQAGGYRARVMLFERERWTDHLEAVLNERDASDFAGGQRGAILTMREDYDKLRNARLIGDDLMVRVFGFFVAYNAANAVLFLNRQMMTTTRLFFRQAFDCPRRPADFRELVDTLVGTVPRSVDEVAQAAEGLIASVMDLARADGLTLEVEELLV